MRPTHWGQRFSGSTRGQIIVLLRRASRTINELADELGLSDNAVRAHLAVLERDGLVQQGTVRRGVGKPAFIYKLTPEADWLFPKAYETVLRHVLTVLGDRVGPAKREELLREVGLRMAHEAGEHSAPVGDLRARLEQAVGVLNNLGGLMELEEEDGTFSICGYSCPLSANLSAHPETCKLMQALLAELVAAPVRERCERSELVSCRFEVPTG